MHLQTGENAKKAETFVCLLFIFKVLSPDHLTVTFLCIGLHLEKRQWLSEAKWVK